MNKKNSSLEALQSKKSIGVKVIIVGILMIFALNFINAFDWTNTRLYYALNESSGNAVDIVNGNTGTATGVAYGVTGKIGTAYDFGTGEYITLTSQIGFKSTDNFTISLWYKGNSTEDTTYGNTIAGWDGDSYAELGIDNGKFAYVHYDTAWRTRVSTTTIANNNFHYLTFVNWANESGVLYVDGTPETYATTIITAGHYFNITKLMKGLGGNANGTIDEFAVFNESLNTSEIGELYNSGNGLFYAPSTPSTTKPTINLSSPANNSMLTNTTNNFTVFYNSTLTKFSLVNSTYYIWYDNGTVYNNTYTRTFGVGINDTNTTVPFNFSTIASYKWNARVCIGNGQPANCSFATNNYTFTLNSYKINSITYNPTTVETTNEMFSLNLTIGEGISLSGATFYYNNSSYTTSIASLGFYRIINASLTTPEVTTAVNLSFLWALNLSNGTSIYVNTSSYNQTVNSLGIDNCSTNTHLILNFTIYDEDTRAFIDNNTANTTTDIYIKLSGDFSGQVYSYYAASLHNNPILICLADSLTAGQNYRLDTEIKFSSDPYVTEYYYIQNYSLNTTIVPLNISLYDLPTASSQEFLITYKDQYYIPTGNALIQIARQYLDLGSFLTVEVLKTDNDGHAIAHLVVSDAVYTIYVIKDGIIQATFENQKATCPSLATGNCVINLNAAGSSSIPSSFINNLGVSYYEVYNDTNKFYSLFFSTSDGSTKTMKVNITKYNAYGNETICTNSILSSSGTLTCTIPSSYYNVTGLIRVYVDGELLSSHLITISPELASSLLDNSRYIIAFFMIITIPLIAGTSGVMTLVFFVLGLVASGSLALMDWGTLGIASIFWIIIAAGIIIFKITRRDKV